MAEDNNEQSVQDFLYVPRFLRFLESPRLMDLVVHRRILEEHRAECEAQGKYVEAEIAKKRLDELHEQ